MNQTELQIQSKAGETKQLTTLQPLDIIRTETVLSKYPIHNPSKKGKNAKDVDINIIKKTTDGNIELKWKVSYNNDYGQPGQLAYKLDTIIVDQAIELAGKPLPERIRLGSLHEICRDMRLTEGKNKNSVKKAFLQNASAFITAKLKYKTNDGGERTLEAAFTRYSIIFTGEKFSDGSRADAVYIELHARYREILNNAPTRPLDFSYKKQLTPTAQRFYEIVSYKIYAALKHKLPVAKLLYSEYCMYSAQQRHFEYEPFRKQMYKVHRPHLASGYIKDVRYDQTTDEQGSADWIMCYTPGKKAIAELKTFEGGKRETHQTPAIDAASQTPTAKSGEREQGNPATPTHAHIPPPVQQQPNSVHLKHLDTLLSCGVAETEAKKLLQSLPEYQPVGDQLEYALSQPGIKNLAAFSVNILRTNDPLPPDFETKSKREARLAREEAERQAHYQRIQQEWFEEKTGSEYNNLSGFEVDEYTDTLPETRQELQENIQAFYAEHPNSNLPREIITRLQKRALTAKYAPRLNLPTLKQYQEYRKTLDIPLTLDRSPTQEQFRELWKRTKAQNAHH